MSSTRRHTTADRPAELDVVVSDARHGAFDWLWAQHRVDTTPPESITIESPMITVPTTIERIGLIFPKRFVTASWNSTITSGLAAV